MTAVGDIIAVVLGRKKPRVSPTGSKVTRTTARQVRSVSSDATEAAIEAIRTAKHTGERALHTAGATGSSAVAGVNGTARAAKRAAPRTARAAKDGVNGTAHLDSDVDQAGGRQCQEGRDHYRTTRSHREDRLAFGAISGPRAG